MREKLKSYWNRQRALLGLCLLVLILGAMIGYVQAERFDALMDQFMQKIEEIGVQNRGFALFSALLINNVSAALLMMFSGIILGIYPVFSLLVNGVAIGYLLQMVAAQGENPLLWLLVGILPHGVFELTAVVVAAAFGVRLGWTAFNWLLDRFRPAEARGSAGALRLSWREVGQQLPLTLNLVFILLIVAALVESTITYALVEMIATR